MRVVDFIKDNQQKAKAVQTQLIDKFEPTFRNWSGTVNKKFTEAIATRPYLSFFNTHTAEQEAWLQQCPELEFAYNDLHKNLGEENYIGEWYTVDQACINQFASATGDSQWIHTDPDRAAKESPFKATIAHGFLILALIPKLTNSVDEDNNPYPEAKMVINFGLNQVRFPSPVKAGTRVRASIKLVNLVPMKRSIEVVNEVSIEVENSKRLACVAEAVLRLYF